jgi:hypothetical protein
VIFAGSIVAVWLIASRRVGPAWHAWSAATFSTQLSLIFAALAMVWLAAGFLDSQLRNLTQLYEGYTLIRLMPRAAERAIAWHRDRYEILTERGNAGLPLRSRYREDIYIQYPYRKRNLLPTRLGNVIRSAEEYAEIRYHADYLIIGPRLSHLCSERFVLEYETFRSAMQFSLVVSFLSGAFTVLAGVIVLAYASSPILFMICVVAGVTLAHIGYGTAVTSAMEYGEQIRASVDLYRNELLVRLRYPIPDGFAQETEYWLDLRQTIRDRMKRKVAYAEYKAGQADATTP